jgi:murein DD-endopeptidase MepM/ murein hydrolase activator NlpD
MTIKLRLPLKHIFVTQPFGVNYVDFYQKMGLSGHPGVDFRAKHGCPIYASNSGVVIRSGFYSDGGIGIEVETDGLYSTFHYHLDSVLMKIGDTVEAGDLIGFCDNTGKYTTADHDHFELRIGGVKTNPAGYFYYTFDGQEINPKDWDKSRCYHRYYRGRPKGGYKEEVRIAAILAKKKLWPTAEKINALVYGGWDLEAVENPAMYEVWSQLKKDEFVNKKLKPFA